MFSQIAVVGPAQSGRSTLIQTLLDTHDVYEPADPAKFFRTQDVLKSIMLARHQHTKSVFKLSSSRDLPPIVRANLDFIVFCAPEDSPLYREAPAELREKHTPYSSLWRHSSGAWSRREITLR